MSAAVSISKPFSFWMPIELRKDEGDAAGPYRLKGFASVEGLDHQEEEILQSGLDFSYCTTEGWFAWGEHVTKDHPIRDPDEFIGYPTTTAMVEIEKDGLKRRATQVEGVLLDTPKAQEVIRLAESLKKAGGGRQLGLSVEGQIVRREGNRIPHAIVRNLLVTPHPAHPDARLEVLARSLTAMNAALDAGYPAPADEPGKGAAAIPQSIEGTLPTLDHDQMCLRVLKRYQEMNYREASALVKEIAAVFAAAGQGERT